MSIRLVSNPRHKQLFLDAEECMGEIRVKVKLTNASDVESSAQGLIAEDRVRSVEVDAIVDTGAVRSVVPKAIVDSLGVRIRGMETAHYANGHSEVVGLTSAILFEVMGRTTSDEALVLGNELLIGQTILEELDLLADYSNRRLVANPDNPDYPVNRI